MGDRQSGSPTGPVSERARVLFERDGYWLDHYPSPDRYDGPGQIGLLRAVTNGWWVAVSLTAVVGAAVGLRRQPELTMWLIALAGSTVLLPLLSVAEARYHDALAPFMAISVGMAVGQLVHAAHGRQRLTRGEPAR